MTNPGEPEKAELRGWAKQFWRVPFFQEKLGTGTRGGTSNAVKGRVAREVAEGGRGGRLLALCKFGRRESVYEAGVAMGTGTM